MEIGDDATGVVNTEPIIEGEDVLNREELERELVATEDDIQTLKEALNVKIKRLVEIKKKLGHTDITTISYDVREGLTRFGESETMQKTQRAFAQARSKTIDVAEDVKEKITTSFENIKNSDTFKNISETMGSAFGTIKALAMPNLGRLSWREPSGSRAETSAPPLPTAPLSSASEL
ncbi:unnamed protein product [Taenia asiatica]|uniref:Tumor protein D52 n=1 Tax=Taenia asiatica TaxID=60517 RepID=A0A0R3WC63_TAEAS|nr:unnamed protein product [Taenia asiatica]